MSDKAPAMLELPPEETVVEAKPSLDDLKEEGLNAREIEAAQKHGLTDKPADKPAEEKPEAAKPEDKAPEKPAAKPEESKPEAKPKLGPDDVDQATFDKWSPNEQGLYWSQKKARARAQRAEAERDRALLKERMLAKELEDLRKQAAPKPPEDKPKDPLDEILDGGKPKETPADGKDKPLTQADLERIEKEKADKAEKDNADRTSRAAVLNARLNEFEAEGKEKFKDFDQVTDLANEILKKGKEVFGDDEERYELAVVRAQKAVFALSNAADWDAVVAKYPHFAGKSPADLVYELGKMHPQYKAASAAAAPSEKPADKDAEKVKRMAENAGKRSSASVGAGGTGDRRLVSEDDITPEQAAKLSDAQWSKLSPATRKRILAAAS